MSLWRISVPLCLIGLFREYRPSEPFISDYLSGPWKNFTAKEVAREVYPLGTYLSLALLIFVFLLTDYLRYKPLIVLGSISGVICWSLLRFGTTMGEIKSTQFFFAFFEATEIAYFTYIYAKVGRDKYQLVTGQVRMATLLGKSAAGLSAQLLVMYKLMDYEELNHLTILGVGLSAICTLALPAVETSMYFHREISPEKPAHSKPKGEITLKKDGRGVRMMKTLKSMCNPELGNFKHAFKLLWKDFKHAFTNSHVLRWSIWWALATCGKLQVHTYVQILWKFIKKGKQMNGFVEFAYSLVAAIVAFCVGFFRMPWSKYGELFLAVVSLLQGALLIYSGFIDNLIIAYSIHMTYGLLYESAITIASSEVAKGIREDSYALVFGVNTFIALFLQTILTWRVVRSRDLHIQTQFIIYGELHILLGLGFIIAGIISYIKIRMSIWRISIPLCLHGLFKEYRPSEPFISSYLKGPWKNFTSEQVNQEIYPLGTYLTLALLVFVFLLTDLLRYKPVIVLGGFAGVGCWSLLRWGTTMQQMQGVEFFYALFGATEVAYYTYIYAKVSSEHYQMVTSHTRAAILLGKAAAGLSSQLLVTYKLMDYETLNYLTIGGVGVATIFGLLLPSVKTSIYFHRTSVKEAEGLEDAKKRESQNGEKNESNIYQYIKAFRFLWQDFLHAFSNGHVIRWSIWWALATCGYLQVTSYAQLLWEEINSDEKYELLNGYVEFGYSLAGALVAFSVGYLRLQWSKVGEIFLAVVSLLQGALLVWAATLDNLILAYVAHMCYGLLYQSAITIASSEVAKKIREDSYALVFGFNFFLALVLQTLVTTIVIEGAKATIRNQFYVYGGFYLFLGVGFTIAGLISWHRYRKRNISETSLCSS